MKSTYDSYTYEAHGPFLNMRTCVLAKRHQSQSKYCSIQSTHQGKYAQNTRMCSCSAPSIEDASGDDLCVPGAAKYPKMHLEQNSNAAMAEESGKN